MDMCEAIHMLADLTDLNPNEVLKQRLSRKQMDGYQANRRIDASMFDVITLRTNNNAISCTRIYVYMYVIAISMYVCMYVCMYCVYVSTISMCSDKT